MKPLLLVIVLAVVALLIYNYASQDDGQSSPPAANATPAAVTPAPNPPPVQPTAMVPVAPPGMARPAGPQGALPAPPQVMLPPPNPREGEIRQIIFQCAQRAQWRIVNYLPQPGAQVRVTGVAPNDNVANQRFLDELERSGILRDAPDTAGHRVFLDERRGVTMLELTLVIKWR